MEKSKKLNNKGYMLVEIILASVLAFGLAYFMIELTLKLKNKNDDLLVETLTQTDNAIISNAIYKYLKENATSNSFVCQNNLITKDGRIIKLNNNFIVEVNEYTTVGNYICNKDNNVINIKVPLTVQKNKKYDVDLYYKIIS